MSIESLRPRVRAARSRKEPPPWSPPVLSCDFLADCWVTAFDQSLSSTGYTRLRVLRGIVEVERHGTLHPRSQRSSFSGTLEKTFNLEMMIYEAMEVPAHRNAVVIEQPLIGPGHRPESALLAAYVIEHWARCQWDIIPAIVSARHASAVLCGNPHHSKKEIAAAVARYIPGSGARSWSEHTRDAAALALAWLHDQYRLAQAEAVK